MKLKRKNKAHITFFFLLFVSLLLFSLWQDELNRSFVLTHFVFLLYLPLFILFLEKSKLRKRSLQDLAEAYYRRNLYMEQSPLGENHLGKDLIFLELQKELLLRFYLFCLYHENQEEKELLRVFIDYPNKKEDREVFIQKLYELM